MVIILDQAIVMKTIFDPITGNYTTENEVLRYADLMQLYRLPDVVDVPQIKEETKTYHQTQEAQL